MRGSTCFCVASLGGMGNRCDLTMQFGEATLELLLRLSDGPKNAITLRDTPTDQHALDQPKEWKYEPGNSSRPVDRGIGG